MDKTKVYILKPRYLAKSDIIDSALDLAKSALPNGPISFCLVNYPESDPKEHLTHDEDWDAKRNIEPSQEFHSLIMNTEENSKERVAPYQDRNWLELSGHLVDRIARASDWFFEEYKEDRGNCLVILLSSYGNDHNYFCGPIPKDRNAAFIQITHYATQLFTAPHIPVAYEFFAAALRFKAFNTPDYQKRFVHFRHRGCVNYFFERIEDIRYKIMSADICNECLNHVVKQRLSPVFLNHVFTGLEKVRSMQNNFRRAISYPAYLSFVLSQRNLTFPTIGAKVSFTPKEMSLYKLFCQYPEGIAFDEIANYRDDLLTLYAQHYAGDADQENRWRREVERVVNRWCEQDKDLSQTISKINRKIKDAVTAELALNYQIRGGIREKRRINAAESHVV